MQKFDFYSVTYTSLSTVRMSRDTALLIDHMLPYNVVLRPPEPSTIVLCAWSARRLHEQRGS